MIYSIKKMGSPIITFGLLFSLLTGHVILEFTGTVKNVWESLDLWSFRIVLLLLVVNSVIALFRGIFTSSGRKWVEIFIYLVTLLIIALGFSMYLWRFEGVVNLGEGEAYRTDTSLYSSLSQGPLATLPELNVTMGPVESGRTGMGLTVIRDGQPLHLDEKGIQVAGYHVTPLRTGLAPLFSVSSEAGDLLESMYVKLHLDSPSGEDSFMFRLLPYEFFISEEADPGSFIMEVRRGKLSLFRGGISGEETVWVEDVAISIPDVKRYGVLRIGYVPGWRFFIMGIILQMLLISVKMVHVVSMR